jgi:hypothetical protein
MANRPTQITTILNMVNAEHPADIGASLETYISSLEANQQIAPLGENASDPTRLYWLGVKRQQNRRLRALRKLNNYQ